MSLNIHSFIHSFWCWGVIKHSFIHSFIHSYIYSFWCWGVIHRFIHFGAGVSLNIHFGAGGVVKHSFIHFGAGVSLNIHSFIHSFWCWGVIKHSFIHSFIHSIIYLCIHSFLKKKFICCFPVFEGVFPRLHEGDGQKQCHATQRSNNAGWKSETQLRGNLSLSHSPRSSQCSTTGVTKAVVCAILSVGWCI